MEIGFIAAALMLCGASVYCFCKANFCACTKVGDCDNPINHYWLGAITAALIALLCCCAALHSEKGTMLWLVLMVSCFGGAVLSAKHSAKKRCNKTKRANALLTNEPN
ncbi:hypothetical protein [Pseudoalteromonas sp. H105]|uniref:hypothetical protein n=1 Tax=Pseudoalteromonas sp. H105 TaxID=1348393 RepID=UPI0009EACA62|nr:hypothetical protein [Pseudoalteromonas sp. H105]